MTFALVVQSGTKRRRAHGSEPAPVQCGSPGCKPGRTRTDMSKLDEFDRRLELIIRELTLRILVPRWNEFDAVWESANRVCDRYQLRKAA